MSFRAELVFPRENGKPSSINRVRKNRYSMSSPDALLVPENGAVSRSQRSRAPSRCGARRV